MFVQLISVLMHCYFIILMLCQASECNVQYSDFCILTANIICYVNISSLNELMTNMYNVQLITICLHTCLLIACKYNCMVTVFFYAVINNLPMSKIMFVLIMFVLMHCYYMVLYVKHPYAMISILIFASIMYTLLWITEGTYTDKLLSNEY